MLDTRNQKSECALFEQALSFFYDELGKEEKSKFEAHLESCGVCPDEISSFVSVSVAIGDWKSLKFNPLETPVIEIPYDNVVAVTQDTEVGYSLSDRLRGLFTFSPYVWQTGSAFAVLAITFGLIWVFFVRSPQSPVIVKQVPEVKAPQTDSVSNPVVAETSSGTPDIAANSNNGTAASKDTEPALPLTVNQPRVSEEKRQIVKPESRRTRNTQQNENTSPSTPRDVKRETVTVEPRLMDVAENSYDDAEDESLRLTDLFAIADSESR